MSLLGAINQRYETSTEPDVVALRAVLGQGFSADKIPDCDLPYVLIGESATQFEAAAKSTSGVRRPTVRLISVLFNGYSYSREQAEEILDMMELAFLEAPEALEISERVQHLGTYPQNRYVMTDGEQVVFALELNYKIVKSYA